LGRGVAIWDGAEPVRAAAVLLAGGSLVALGIAWDALGKFRSLLNTPRPDEQDMAPVWERRSRRWRGIGLTTLGVYIILLAAWAAVRRVS